MIAKCTKPCWFVCHNGIGYDKNHYTCLSCSFNSVAPYKRGMMLKIGIENLYWKWKRNARVAQTEEVSRCED
jgi:hypothetical protein